jgi:hypothetical protein
MRSVVFGLRAGGFRAGGSWAETDGSYEPLAFSVCGRVLDRNALGYG